MVKYRVGAEGLRVSTASGTYTLPPGAVLDEIPEGYEGRLEVIVEGKRMDAYGNKMIQPAEDKATPARRPDPRLRNPLTGTN
jgi:hypothetical protein